MVDFADSYVDAYSCSLRSSILQIALGAAQREQRGAEASESEEETVV